MKTQIIQTDPPPEDSGTSSLATTDGSETGRPDGRGGGALGIVRRHPLIAFFVISYAVAWMFLPWGGFLPCGPLVAALIVVPIARGRAGMRELGSRMIRWRVSWVWYVAAIAVPLAVNGATTGLNLMLGASPVSASQFSPWYGVLLVFGAALVDPLGGPLGEEPGWRGVATPWLQERRSPLASAAILSLLVTGWHLPLVFIPQFDLAPQEILTTVAVTFWYVWLFNRTGGSVLLPLIAHATEGSIDLQSFWPAGTDDASRLSWIWLVVWTAVALALVIVDRAAWRSRQL